MRNKKQGLLLILDGLGDRGIDAFDRRTPLESADTPNMDRLIVRGQGGLIDPLYPGVPVGTHTGTGILLGLPPQEAAALARGPVEAAGIGLDSMEGDILLRCNFATLESLEQGFRIRDRRAGRISEQTEELAAALQAVKVGEGIQASLYPATGHRAVLRLRGPGLSPEVTDTDPGSGFQDKGLLPALPRRPEEAAARTANAINRFSHIAWERLEQHPVNQQRLQSGLPPANGLLCRSAGRRQRPLSLIRHFGLSASLVGGESTVIGLGDMLGYHVISDPRFTSLANTDIGAKVTAAREALGRSDDLVVIHLKGPDICAHDRDPIGKRDLLEAMDRALASLPIEELVVGITGDHSTDCNTGNHVGDPVPSLLSSPHGRRDRCSSFGETECASGGLGRVSGSGFFCSLLDEMGFMHKYNPEFRHLFTPG